MTKNAAYLPIGDYAFISDCYSVALVSREGSIDWCCMPRIDSGSVFGRLLDWEKGGYCSVYPEQECETTYRHYMDSTLVLETRFKTAGGEARLLDCFAMREGGKHNPYNQLLRIVEGVQGRVDLHLMVAPRFDYGAVKPWIRYAEKRRYSAIGGDDALIVSGDADIGPVRRRSPATPTGEHELEASFTVRAGERVRTSIMFVRPEILDQDPPKIPDSDELDRRFEETLQWWERWSSQAEIDGLGPEALRSATVIKGLTHAPTGAIAAAATTSLPESPGGSLNWDYRYSWVRDAAYSLRALRRLGFTSEAEEFRKFMQRSAAGSAEDLELVYGVGGERRLTETLVEHLEGYRGARPVRVGNAASNQLQLDTYGEMVELSWRGHQRGYSPDDDYWRFLVELIETAAERWKKPDRGLWEIRGEPRHFVHSKVMCWVALEFGLHLAEECMRKAPEKRWRKTRDEIREAVESEGYDEERGIFVQAFGTKELDAALLLLPTVGFVDYDDERMIRTTEAIRRELDDEGLIRRYRNGKDLNGDLDEPEGAFLACSFWLVECLAHQGRMEEAMEIFDRTSATSNDLGLFSEEYDTQNDEMLGNFPQALTHLSHLTAMAALAEHGEMRK